ncbi:MAG TPA: response regulator, partial [Candidatus Saccharimonadales bacterium]|nr:response regulator [Candidatus Saccharimonadales bacterium]
MSQKIVLADDEQFIAIAYNDALQRAGYTVFVASNGEEALELIQKETPDLILLDLMMPKKDGFEVLSIIKADPALKNIPVLVLSNLSQPSDEVEVRKQGAVDFLVKAEMSLD